MYLIHLKHLRLMSLVEGFSYLLLVFVGMPLKYLLAIKDVNYVLGMGHGILSLFFYALLLLVYSQKTASFRLCMFVFIASLIPFGAFFAEMRLKKIPSS